MESVERTAEAQKFNPPGEGNSGLYIYRSGSFGGAFKKMFGLMENESVKLHRMYFSMKKLKLIKSIKFPQNLNSPLMIC